jgi:TetR/AcrR family transcriptional regulator, transcriptional repressor for nem operon
MATARSRHESKSHHESKSRLLDAAVHVIRAKGYAAATIDDICEYAGLTKGSFFHHFEGKQQLALAAAVHFSSMAKGVFATAPYRGLSDPLDRLLGYVDFRKAMLQGELPEYTCFFGTMVQETYDTHPSIRKACERGISEHAASLEADIAEAMRKYKTGADWSAKSLALHTQAVIQGAFILAKSKNGPAVAGETLDHLRRYLELLFDRPNRR